MADALAIPFAIYDVTRYGIAYLGLHEDEASVWRIYLGWPDAAEIAAAKARGLRVISGQFQYTPPKD